MASSFSPLARLLTRPHLKKLEDRSIPMVLVEYEEGTKGYRVYNLTTKRVVITRDVVFDEGARCDREKSAPAQQGTHGALDSFTVEHISYRLACDTGDNTPSTRQGGYRSRGSMEPTAMHGRGEATAGMEYPPAL
uniref:Retroviral polymerase SH3-like domain-containing protein n=1 Tax=Oryza brachyantha TaxID=4533 RepID=J3MIT7_ORYBR